MSLRVIFKHVNNVYHDYMKKVFECVTQGTASSRNNFARHKGPF